ncbi:MAG: hypothetical protein HYX76_15335 [Acidobacteria bacterium]|nr:hypothetical protein [Acidobacteriota bacterium]
MRRVGVQVAASLTAAVALWCTFGMVTLAGAGANLTRIGFLPPLLTLAIFVALALVGVFWRRPADAVVLPLFVTGLVVLPWLPLPVPASALIWAGPLRFIVWIAALAGVVAGTREQWSASRPPRLLRTPRGAATFAGLVAFAIYVVAAARLTSAGLVPGGDEPHYLIVTQSLLLDGDLQIENNHTRRDYRAYFPGVLRPDYLQRGTNGQIYSIHAPGLPALLVPVFAAGGYRLVIIFLCAASAAATSLAWILAFSLTASAGAAWFGWAAVALAPPFLLHAFAVYPDALASGIVLTGVAGLLATNREQRAGGWAAHGLALAALPWLHTRYAVLAASIGSLIVVRLIRGARPVRDVAAFLAVPFLSALLWLAFFWQLYGRFNPTAPYGGYTQSALAYIRTGLPALLFDQQYGLVANAPVLLAGLAGLAIMYRGPRDGSPQSDRRLAIEITIVLLPYLMMAGAYRMWWGGRSAPARFAVPIVLPLAIPCAILWVRARTRATRALAIAGLAGTLALAAVMLVAERGSLGYNERNGFAMWLDWVNPHVNLPLALPSFIRHRSESALGRTAVWLGMLVMSWLGLRWVERRARTPGAIAAATALLLGASVMVAATTVWAIDGVRPETPNTSAIYVLRRVDPRRLPIAVDLTAFDFGAPDRMLGRVDLTAVERHPAAPMAGTVLFLPFLPAGRYEVRAGGAAGGTLSIGIGRIVEGHPLPGPFRRIDLDAASPESRSEIDLPVDANSVFFTGDDRARSLVRSIALRPVEIHPSRARPTDAPARHARSYGVVTVFALDDQTYLEPAGFWVAPGKAAASVFSGTGGAGLRLLVRNGAARNHVEITSHGWRADLDVAAGEEQVVEVPVDAALSGTLVRFQSSSGFRPSDVDPRTSDTRLLGCWVEIQNLTTAPK